VTVVPKRAPALLRHPNGLFAKGCNFNPAGRPKGSLNRNKQLLHEVKKFALKDAEGRKIPFERALLEIALKRAATGDAALAIEILKKLYLTLTPEAAGINIVNNASASSYEAAISQLHAERTGIHSRLGGEDVGE
jgi:hypothetical protein